MNGKIKKKFSPKNIVYGTRGSRAEYVTECTNYYCIASVLYETEYVFINIPENRITEQSQNKFSRIQSESVGEIFATRLSFPSSRTLYKIYAAEHRAKRAHICKFIRKSCIQMYDLFHIEHMFISSVYTRIFCHMCWILW